ncbi:MAG: hypothetical protein EBR30_21075 [Cytophagia bacterium]|nr:hypothetical protein [Cytophagia bacterium]
MNDKLTQGKQFEYFKWALLILAVYIIFKILKGFKSLTETGSSIFGGGTGGGLGAGVFDLPTDSLQKELDKYKKMGWLPTISESQASDMAEIIYRENQSMDTNENTIKDVFRKLRREPDMLLLKLKFGTRRPQFEVGYMGLSAFLRADLSNDDIAEINEILSKRALKPI